MARIRSIHPGLFTDEAWVSCSPLARILVIGLWTDADDQGVFEWKPLQLKMRLLPGDSANVSELLEEIQRAGMVIAYEVDGRRFGAIKNFRKFQRPQKPNCIHPLPDSIATFVHLSRTDPQPVQDRSDTDPVIPPQMEDGGGEGEGNGVVLMLPKDRASDQVWADRLKEAQVTAGAGADLTSGAMHTYADLRRLCEPCAGEPCTWGEVLDAVRAESTGAIRRGNPIRSWTWIDRAALRLRDRRLAGLPDAKPVPSGQGPPSLTDKLAEERRQSREMTLKALGASNG